MKVELEPTDKVPEMLKIHELARVWGMSFADTYAAICAHRIEPDAVVRCTTGGFIPLWDKARAEKLRALVIDHERPQGCPSIFPSNQN